MRRLLPLAVSLVLAGAAAAAENPVPQPFEPAIVEVRVNDEARAVTLIVRRDADGTLLIRQADLAELRIKTPSRGVVVVDGERYLRMGPEIGARVKFDAATQTADIMLPPGAFVATRTSALSPDAPVVTAAGLGGFANYDLYGEQVDGQTQTTPISWGAVSGDVGTLYPHSSLYELGAEALSRERWLENAFVLHIMSFGRIPIMLSMLT